MNKIEWEELFKNYNVEGGSVTYRAKIFGGWLVHSYNWGRFDKTGTTNERSCSESMVFVPDPNHNWEV